MEALVKELGLLRQHFFLIELTKQVSEIVIYIMWKNYLVKAGKVLVVASK